MLQYASVLPDERLRAHSDGGSLSSSSGESASAAPSRLVPGHRMWANRNGRHVLGLIEDYNALRKQISEGRKLSRSMDAQLQECLHSVRLQGSDIKVPTSLTFHFTVYKSYVKRVLNVNTCVCVLSGDGTAACEGFVWQCEHHAAGVGGGWAAAQTGVESLSACRHYSRRRTQQSAGVYTNISNTKHFLVKFFLIKEG